MIAAILTTVAAAGGFSLVHAGPRQLGFAGAACGVAAFTLLIANQARDARSLSRSVIAIN